MTGCRFAPIALLAVTMLLASCSRQLDAPVINGVVDNVDGFDLELDDVAVPVQFGLFEVGYAIKANYAYFTYRGKLYRSIGGGSVLIRPAGDSPAKFMVRETPNSRDEHGVAKSSTLEILDKQTGQVLAHRRLTAHAVEDSHGWTGDHAVKFIRGVLRLPQYLAAHGASATIRP